MLRKVREFLLDRDVYGQPIGVHFGGKTKYNTWLGVLCTFMVYGIVCQSAVVLSRDYWTN